MKLVKEHIDFKRGMDPKDAMQTGMVSQFPQWQLFHLLHQESKNSENFNYVTPIDYEHKTKYQHANKNITDDPSEMEVEPKFSIESKFVYSRSDDGTDVRFKRYTIYLTKDEGILLFDDNTEDEKEISNLKMFNKVTWCLDID